MPVEFTNKPVLGWRDTIKIHSEEKEITKKVDGKDKKEKKTWSYYELSDYKVGCSRWSHDRGILSMLTSPCSNTTIHASLLCN